MLCNRTRYADLRTIFGMGDRGPGVQEVLWQNCQALMVSRYGKENLTQFAKDTKIGPGSASRIKARKTSVGLDVLSKIADSFDLQPWHLLMPNLDPSNPPVVMLTEAEQKLYKRLKRAHDVLVKEES